MSKTKLPDEHQRGLAPSPHSIVLMEMLDHILGSSKSNLINKPKDETRNF